MSAVPCRMLLLLPLLIAPSLNADEDPLRTVAERSEFTRTSRHADVLRFCEALAKRSPLVKLDDLGKSHEGKTLPLLVVSDPAISSPAQARKAKKTVVFILCNIHAGEVAGKEGVMMLVRELALGKDRELLKKLVLLIAPNFNADGNDKMAKGNRPGQVGPDQMGLRANAQGFDLNRDFVKLESPEVRALVRCFNEWDPDVFLDMHTTNGSKHRYVLTYDGPRHPATPEKIVNAVRDTMLPAIGKKLEKRGGYRSFHYGNFARDLKSWTTYPALPRYGIAYVGLRNRISFLSEAYSYASYKDRVLASRDFARSCLEYVAENEKTIAALLRDARTTTVDAGKNPRGDSRIPLRFESVPLKKPFTVLGYKTEEKDGKRSYTDEPMDYVIPYVGLCKPTLSVTRPYAYLIPKGHRNVVENLQRHGIIVEELREDVELDVEAYRVDRITKSLRSFQKHRLVTLAATPRTEARMIKAGTLVVRTGQPLGTLAAYLLEPRAEDGLTAWNFFDAALKEKTDFPVLRLPKRVALIKEPLTKKSSGKKAVTWDDLQASKLPSFSGSPTSITWLDDGEHFLQRREGKLYKVRALSGRATLTLDDAALIKALRKLPDVNAARARAIVALAPRRMNKQRSAFLFSHKNDLHVCRLDGFTIVQVTKTPKREESLADFSPDGKRIAFVRDNDLYVVDVAGQTETRLTKDGGELIFNGRADWVYYEEVFHRNRKAYWWSPDSERIAFLRFDDGPVPLFTVTNPIPLHQKLEPTRYPKPGDPNPLVKLGIATVRDGKTSWVDVKDYDAKDLLIVRVGWFPKGKRAYYYAQNRTQTRLDLCAVSASGDDPQRLIRETSKAWVDNLGEPHFLKNGTFLWASERDGWRHYYHYSADGKLLGRVTKGEWEARRLHHVDEENRWAFVSGTRDSPVAEHLYRVNLDGSAITRVGGAPGHHRIQFGKRGDYYVASRSSFTEPTKVSLCDAMGRIVRQLDVNPVRARDNYHFVKTERARIKTPDGFLLEATILKPPHFDPKKSYPVWLKTYGGPHAPTVSDSWRGGNVTNQALATMGFIVFSVDPRSASGKGAQSTRTAYRQLGVQELKDLETAVKWLCTHPWADAKRVGISGGSYGGFLTAYALTHSRTFAAGVAAAPVTDWRLYDSIYTERFMGLPKDNKEGYDKTSVVKAAKNLHGKLLIVHGLMDDNVHAQNTLQLVDQLQHARKEFEMMIYPRSRHGGFGRHFTKLSTDFMRRALRP